MATGLRRFALAAMAAAWFSLPSPASAAQPGPSYALARTVVRPITDTATGRSYAVSIALPLLPPPPQGYATLYVLDGDFYFASMVEASRAGAPDVVVVGIGYPQDDASAARYLAGQPAPPAILDAMPRFMLAAATARNFDLTLPASAAELQDEAIPGAPALKPEAVGGADGLLRLIETRVKPLVASEVKVDPHRQVLFGYSLGGLAALHALLSEPDAFSGYVIASPSIWWNHKAALKGEAAFARKVTDGSISPHVLITVGAEEGNLFQNRYHMVDNAQALAERLSALKPGAGFSVRFTKFDGVSHGLSAWPAMASALIFAEQGR